MTTTNTNYLKKYCTICNQYHVVDKEGHIQPTNVLEDDLAWIDNIIDKIRAFLKRFWIL